jgi:hypothetical protein
METLMKKSLFRSLCVVWLSIAVSALAHHSPAVFDRTKEVKLVGVVKEFKWGNPHSWIEMEIRNESGTVEGWSVEMNPPSYLVKAGWKSTTIKAGETVTVMINPLRTNEKSGKFVSITLPDGKVLKDTP